MSKATELMHTAKETAEGWQEARKEDRAKLR